MPTLSNYKNFHQRKEFEKDDKFSINVFPLSLSLYFYAHQKLCFGHSQNKRHYSLCSISSLSVIIQKGL